MRPHRILRFVGDLAPLGRISLRTCLLLACGLLLLGVRPALAEEGFWNLDPSKVFERGGVLAYAFTFLAGLGTTLTPCVYPLIPITISLFGARDDEVTRMRALFLATCYVGGIAAMYTGLGLSAGLMCKQFGAFMASPYVIVPIALFFLAMAASMFGAFELALPVELQGRLSQVGGRGPGGAFLMGMVAGIIAAPCTGPPLAALLAYVCTQNSALTGGSMLFVYALGMGVPFFLIAGFALKLPKSGAWMEGVKSVFGIIMVVAALYYLRNVLPVLREFGWDNKLFLGGSVILAVVGVALGAIHLSFHEDLVRVVRKGFGVLLVCGGLFGVLSYILAPKALPKDIPALRWVTDEAEAVQRAKLEKKPMLIDFAAEWCLPCKELELTTFADPRVRVELSRYVVARIDCTDPDEKIEAVKARYGASTLPTVVILDSTGREVKKIREYVTAEKILPLLESTR